MANGWPSRIQIEGVKIANLLEEISSLTPLSTSMAKSNTPSANSPSTDSVSLDIERIKPGACSVNTLVNSEIREIATNSGTATVISPTKVEGSNSPSLTISKIVSSKLGSLISSSLALGVGTNSLPVRVNKGSSN